jgi:hypothetical protein
VLEKEFRQFARAIAKAGGTSYQLAKYLDVHARRPIGARTAFDAFLLNIARSGAPGLWLADSYSGLFARKSVLRVKLVLAMALLECSGPSFEELDRPTASGAMAWIHMGLAGAGAAFGVMFGLLLFLPAKILLRGKTAVADV